MKQWLAVLSILVLAGGAGGCAGFRSGYASIPYVGDAAPEVAVPESGFQLGQLQQLPLPGLGLEVSLNNSVRTRDIQVILFFVPVYVDLADHPYYKDTDRLTARLTLVPAEAGYRLAPGRLAATLDGTACRPVAASLKGWGGGTAGATPPALDDALVAEVPLVPGIRYRLETVFDCPVPGTERQITLDPGAALHNPAYPAPPLIRFRQQRWKEGYT